MKSTFIIFLFIIFSSNFSLANNNKKITVEEIENIFFPNMEKFTIIKWQNGLITTGEVKKKRELQNKKFYEGYEESKKKAASERKRPQIKGISKCFYMGSHTQKKCSAKIIRAVFTYPEKSKKRRPGDIFYALDAITFLSTGWEEYLLFRKRITFHEGDKPTKGMMCNYDERQVDYKGINWIHCYAFKGSSYKKFEKFKKDPSNEKVLGWKLIKFIKQVRMVRRMEEKFGTKNYFLLGDMLNATVGEVKKNNVLPELKQRRVLLKKYLLILSNIKKKLDEEKYKSINKDVLKLSKTYKSLKTLKTNSNEMVITIDEAVNIIFDINKLVQTSALNAKDSEEEKLLAQSSITFMESLIDSILSTIPEKYYAEPQELPQDFFSESELAELENIIDSITKNNKEIKSAELNKSMDIIKKYINTSNVLKILNNLGIKNNINEEITINKASKIATQQIRDNLDSDILKSARKIFQEMDRNELADLTKEASSIASEVASSSSVKDTVSVSAVDREYGGQNLKKLIGAARR